MTIRNRSKKLLNSLLLLPLILFAFTAAAYEPDRPVDLEDQAFYDRVVDGEKLFKANCSSCHAVNRNLTGPALAGITDRWESEELLILWIRNNAEVLASGNEYAVNLYNEWNQSPMNLFLQLSEDQVLNIIDYVRAYDPYTELKEQALSDETGDVAAAPAAGPNKAILWTLLGFLALLLLILSNVTRRLDRLVKEKEGIEIPEKKPLLNRLLSKRVLSTVGLIIAIFLGFSVMKGAVDLGRSQGYAPEQPIKFSHVIHAGQNQIDCQYCHTGVEKSKHAYIPSVTVCMNCHKYVQEGPQYGTEEIAKIYEASGWNAEEAAYTNDPKPIEWVKIHNLPDHVYFSHAQHVKAGGLDCQTCHGNIEEMEVVQQFAPLSMGWCVNCHRDTEVKFTGNEYYETTFERFHNELKMQERSGVTVAEIGGTECQKCHY